MRLVFPPRKNNPQVASEGYRDRKHRNTSRSSPANGEHSAVKSKLSYPEFLDALVVLGERMYRASRSRPAGGGNPAVRGESCDRSVESTFQQVGGGWVEFGDV